MVKNLPANARDGRFDPWVGDDHLEKEIQPAIIFLPGKCHGQRNLAGYCPWGCKRVRQGLASKRQQQQVRREEELSRW